MIDYYQWIDTDTKQPIDCAGELAGQLKPTMTTQEIYHKLYQFRQEIGERHNFNQIAVTEANKTIDFLEEAKAIFETEETRRIYDKKLSDRYVQLRQYEEQIIAQMTDEKSTTDHAIPIQIWLLALLVLSVALFTVIFLKINLVVVLIIVLVSLALVLLFRNG